MITRYNEDYPPPYPTGTSCTAGTSNGAHTEAADCSYEEFAYFTNTVNMADIHNISAIPEWNSWNDTVNPHVPTSFNTVAIITTSNSSLAANMKAAFGTPALIFTETMPGVASASPNARAPVLNACLGVTCDTFSTLIRYTLPENATDSSLWQSGGNILVYRVKAPSTGGTIYDGNTVYSGIFGQSCNTDETGATADVSCPTTSTQFDADLQEIAAQLKGWAGTTGHTYAYHQANGAPVAGPICIVGGTNCNGGTQDTDAYRTYKSGALVNQYPIFVVGVLHSASVGDFTTPAPVNNATYAGISIADSVNNVGVADNAEANTTAEYMSNGNLTGSAKQVLLGLGLYSATPTSVKADINNLYIRVFYRQDAGQACTLDAICSPNNPYTTLVATGPAGNGQFPAADSALLTERGYLLPPSTAGTTPPVGALYTGAAAGNLESPYIVCDTAESAACPANPH